MPGCTPPKTNELIPKNLPSLKGPLGRLSKAHHFGAHWTAVSLLEGKRLLLRIDITKFGQDGTKSGDLEAEAEAMCFKLGGLS